MKDLYPQILVFGGSSDLSSVSYCHRKIHRFGCYFRMIDRGVGYCIHPVAAAAAGDIDSLSRWGDPVAVGGRWHPSLSACASSSALS
jgi:hypothetical protein